MAADILILPIKFFRLKTHTFMEAVSAAVLSFDLINCVITMIWFYWANISTTSVHYRFHQFWTLSKEHKLKKNLFYLTVIRSFCSTGRFKKSTEFCFAHFSVSKKSWKLVLYIFQQPANLFRLVRLGQSG